MSYAGYVIQNIYIYYAIVTDQKSIILSLPTFQLDIIRLYFSKEILKKQSSGENVRMSPLKVPAVMKQMFKKRIDTVMGEDL